MTSPVFGKKPLHNLLAWNIHKPVGLLIIVYDAGSRIAHLGSDMRNKLKAAYTLIEQLYTGAQWIIFTTSHNKPPPTLIKGTLERLSMLPAQIEELKKSAARAGAQIGRAHV